MVVIKKNIVPSSDRCPDPFKGLSPAVRKGFDNCMERLFGCDPAYHGFHADFTVKELIPVFMAGVELGRKLRVAERTQKGLKHSKDKVVSM